MTISSYRTPPRRGAGFGGRRNSGNKKVYLNNWKPSLQPEWIKFVRGAYAFCDVCGGNVQPDPESFAYTCANKTYGEDHRPRMNGTSLALCGHTGVADPATVTPYCEVASAFLPNAGPNGMVVHSNSRNGRRAVPDLLYHYKEEDPENIKIRSNYAHTIVVNGAFHMEKRTAASGNSYEVPERCTGARCDKCRTGVPIVDGIPMAYSPGWGHWNNLAQINERISEVCVNCRKGVCVPLIYQCPREECQHLIYDLCEVSEAEALDVYRGICRDLVSKDSPTPGYIACPGCAEAIIPEEILDCRNITFSVRGDVTEVAAGCGNPARMTIFDCEVQLAKSSAEKTADLVMVTFDPTSELTPDQIERAQPNDFMELTDLTPERQAEKMKRPNVFYSSSPRGGGTMTARPGQGPDQSGGTVRPAGSVNYGPARRT